MDGQNRGLLLLLVCLCADWTCGSVHTGRLYPPSNITFGMYNMFCLFWKWTPTNSTAQCLLRYKTEIQMARMRPGEKDTNLYYIQLIDNRIDLNKDITLEASTECGNRTSLVKTFTSALTTGDPRTMVKNMTCVWHYKEYVDCTWHPGEVTPPNVNYSLHYWLSKEDSCPQVENKQPTPFADLLDGGDPCQDYTYHNGIPVGCRFRLEASDGDLRLVAVVTDRAHNIKPYIYFTACVSSIAKLKAPVITEIKRTQNESVFVSWNVSDIMPELKYQVSSSDSTHEVVGTSKEFPNVLRDSTYSVKVRVALPEYVTCSTPNPRQGSRNVTWSEWSEEKTLQAEEDGRTQLIVVLLLVSLVVLVATVLLLINLRRLLLLLCPRIPDPSTVISKDFQHWLQYGKSVYNEPKREEVCVVSLLETQPSSSPA
ncbi:interleukin-13 receptor subunit alpha-1-like [Leptodactylus fuscus]|uniref:interleukin-13 receptor subunit alpha-1-like n=1 Tax=Leptodactylus fuscus TaxID=238119 RepID=UPI003F4EE33C